MTDAGVTDKVAFYNNLVENEDFSIELAFHFLELDEKTGMLSLKSEDF